MTAQTTTTTSAKQTAPANDTTPASKTFRIYFTPTTPLSKAVASLAGAVRDIVNSPLELGPDSSVADLKMALAESAIPGVVAGGDEPGIILAASGMSAPEGDELATKKQDAPAQEKKVRVDVWDSLDGTLMCSGDHYMWMRGGLFSYHFVRLSSLQDKVLWLMFRGRTLQDDTKKLSDCGFGKIGEDRVTFMYR